MLVYSTCIYIELTYFSEKSNYSKRDNIHARTYLLIAEHNLIKKKKNALTVLFLF